MTSEASDLLKKTMSLAPEERASLASSLLESLDETMDENAEEAWNAEIARRIVELDSDKVKNVSWAEARRQISTIVNGR